MRHLILADRHLVGAVDQDVGRLQQRVAQKTVGRQILAVELFLLILVGRHPLQPAERCHHRQQQMQFSVLGYLGLNEQRRLIGIDSSRQPVGDHVPGILFDIVRIIVFSGQGMPIRHEEQAGIFVLQFDPVAQYPMIVAKMQRPGRTHAGKNSFRVHDVLPIQFQKGPQ
ncbi:MAG: hypothetical protein BWY57_02707 [Betaproteobacteria bacterium ADurb.Bin341]|nr:MAG: hypothetical protein BWY57_02707 [Betaproteobacteria bacterium ADurb.Bin341]